jgi:hypothetical protein
MGVERAVTRWYLHRQLLLNQVSAKTASSDSKLPSTPVDSDQEGAQNTETQGEVTRLGPCPKPMMG